MPGEAACFVWHKGNERLLNKTCPPPADQFHGTLVLHRNRTHIRLTARFNMSDCVRDQDPCLAPQVGLSLVSKKTAQDVQRKLVWTVTLIQPAVWSSDESISTSEQLIVTSDGVEEADKRLTTGQASWDRPVFEYRVTMDRGFEFGSRSANTKPVKTRDLGDGTFVMRMFMLTDDGIRQAESQAVDHKSDQSFWTTPLIVAVSVACAAAILLLIALLCLCRRRRPARSPRPAYPTQAPGRRSLR